MTRLLGCTDTVLASGQKKWAAKKKKIRFGAHAAARDVRFVCDVVRLERACQSLAPSTCACALPADLPRRRVARARLAGTPCGNLARLARMDTRRRARSSSVPPGHKSHL